MVGLTYSYDNKAAFLAPLRKFCIDPEHEDFIVHKCNIHHVTWKRDPDDPEHYLEDPKPPNSKSKYNPRHVVIVSCPGERNNTKANRAHMCKNVCNINNNPNFQQTHYPSAYRGFDDKPIESECGGDITPSDPAELPMLSDFLTIRDCLSLIAKLYWDPETKMERSYTDLADPDNELLEPFFDSSLLPKAREVCHSILNPNTTTSKELEEALEIQPLDLGPEDQPDGSTE